MRILLPVLLLGTACASVPPQSAAPDPPPLAIVDVAVFDVERGRMVPDQTVLVEGGVIRAVGPEVAVPPGARVIEGAGRYVIPGLVDTHVHVAFATGTEQLQALLHDFVANGITTVRDASGIGREAALVTLAQRVEHAELVGPRLYVSGTVGPTNAARYGVSDLVELVRRLAAAGVDGLKIRGQLTRDDLRAVTAEAARAGLPVYGHTYDYTGPGDDTEYTLAAVRLGVSGVMHVEGIPQLGPDPVRPAPPPGPRFGDDNWAEWWLHAASGWLLADAAAERALIDTMVARSAWLEPTLITEDWIANPETYRADWVRRHLPGTFDEAQSSYGLPAFQGAELEQFRAAYERMLDFVRRFHEAGGLVTTGTDCMPTCGEGVRHELQLLAHAGLTPAAALRAATLDAARALGWDRRLGAVAPGMLADLVLLDADPLADLRNVERVAAVLIGGRFLDRAALDALRAPAPD